VLNGFRWVITTGAAFQSEAPPAFRPRLRTGDYVLWEQAQTGKRGDPATLARRTLSEPNGPGAALDCAAPEGKMIAAGAGTATVFSKPPVSKPASAWVPSSKVTDDRPVSAELALNPGRWLISLQYVATQDLHISAPGLDRELNPNLDFRGPSAFWPVGEIEVATKEPVSFEVSVDRPTLAGRLLGADGLAYLGPLAATPVGPPEGVPISQACGRYVDWYRR
jgi:hypothetical protein